MSREFESDDLKLSISRERAHELGQILIGLDTELSKCEAEISSLPNMDVLVENENKAKEDAEHARSKLTAAIQTESRLADILQNAKNRKETCTEEEVQWQRRLEGVANLLKS